MLKYKNNELHFGGQSLLKLAKKHGTPLYVYDLDKLQSQIDQVRHAFPTGKIQYAMKANNNLQILKKIRANALGVDVVSGGELELALRAGFRPDRIVFSGVGKSVKEIALAVGKKIASLNVESFGELRRIEDVAKKLKKTANVSLRINPNVDAQTHKHITTGKEENKFGIPKEELDDAVKFLDSHRKTLNLVGVTFHLGSQIQSLSPYKQAFRKTKIFASKLIDMNFPLKHLSIGGGFSICYKNEKAMDLKKLAEFVRKEFKDFPLQPMCEPGRVLVAEAGILLTSVEYIKKSRRTQFAIVNTGMHHLIRPALYDALHEIISVHKKSKSQVYDVVGPICESTDVLGRGRRLSELKENDVIAILNVGAYGRVMASEYNCQPLPKEIVMSGSKYF